MSDTTTIMRRYSATTKEKTILVVEDDVSLRPVVCTMFQRLGFRVLEAVTGEEGIKVWSSRKDEIDLVFTDIMLGPGISGLEMAARLLQLEPNLKIIFTTGFGPGVDKPGFKEMVGEWLLPKPFAMRQLMEMVERRLADTVGPATV